MTLTDLDVVGDVLTTMQPYVELAVGSDEQRLLELRAGVALASAESLDDQAARFLGFRGTMQGETIELQTLPNPNVRFPVSFARRTASMPGVIEALTFADVSLAAEIIGVFFVMNQVHPDIIARSAADIWAPVAKGMGTKDKDIIERRVLFLDHDPDRLPGISANEDERALARLAAERTYLTLTRILDPELHTAIGYGDSGNGFHVPLAVSIECGDEGDRVVHALLLAAHELFSTDGVKLDTSVGDQKRLCPAYGTMKRKGENTIDRPHRATFFWGSPTPDRLQLGDLKHIVWALRDQIGDEKKRADIEAILDPPNASKVPSGKGAPRTTAVSPQRTPAGTSIFDQVKTIAVRDVAAKLGLLDGEDVTCPGCREQSGVGFFENGVKCHHDRCSQKGKKGFRTNVDLAMEVYGCDAKEAAAKLAAEFGIQVSAYSATSAGGDWPELVPLVAPREPQPFPVDALPAWMSDWVQAEAIETQTPADLPAMLALVACSVSVAKKYKVHVRGNWFEPLNLYAVAALSPGNRKSAVFEHATSPIVEEQERLIGASKADVVRARHDLEVYNRQTEQLIRKAGGDDDAAIEAKRKLKALPSPPTIPNIPRLIADDMTSESLVQIFAENDGRLAVLAPEGGIFTILSGAYNEKVNLDPFLKGHGDESITVHRIGRPFLFVPNATLTVGLTVQPDVLVDLVANEIFRGRGLSARFLYFFPNDLLGYRQVNAPTMPKHVRERYEKEVRQLLALPLKRDEENRIRPQMLVLGEGAQEVRTDFEEATEYRLREEGDLPHMKDWGGKLTGAMLRVSGLLHLASGSTSNAVSQDTMISATRIGEYLIDHAKGAFGAVGVDGVNTGARHVLKWIERSSSSAFTKRDAHNALRAHFKHADELDPTLESLVSHNYLRDVSVPHFGKGRPPSPRFEVNPRYLAQKTQKSQKGGS